MNDSYACIPPGTPISLESRRSVTTHGSNGSGIGAGESDVLLGRLDMSRDDAVVYRTTDRWPLPPLPILRHLKRCAQFDPPGFSTDVADYDNDDRHDVTSGSLSNQTINTIACTDSSIQHRLLSARSLTKEDENPLNLGSLEIFDGPPKENSNISACVVDQNLQLDPSMQAINQSKNTSPMSPSSLFLILEQEQRLSSIPMEISIPSQLDYEDDDDDSIPEEPYTQGASDKVNFSAHWILPSPRDIRRQRRQQRTYVQLDVNGFVCQEGKEEMPSDVSFTDIVCRHVKRSRSLSVTISSVEDECSLPLYIEVKDSSAPRSNFIWRTHYTPEYASV